MKIWKNAVLFYTGGLLYQIIELLWRGRTHWSMFLAGGFCFWLIAALGTRWPRLPVLGQMLLATAAIVLTELACGLIVNRALGLGVWDYSAMPYQLWGQICLPFALLWFALSMAAILAADWLRTRLFHDPRRRYRWI